MSQITITLAKATLLSKCEKISSFEGREAVSASGESAYLSIHMTDQDEPLIEDYIARGASALETFFAGKLTAVTISTETTDTDVVFTFQKDSSRLAVGGLKTQCTEAIVAYVLKQWLSDRKPDRVTFYQELFTDMAKAAVLTLCRKNLPTYA